MARKRYEDIEIQKLFSEIDDKRSLIFYLPIKNNWGREVYVDKASKDEREGLAWLRDGAWR